MPKIEKLSALLEETKWENGSYLLELKILEVSQQNALLFQDQMQHKCSLLEAHIQEMLTNKDHLTEMKKLKMSQELLQSEEQQKYINHQARLQEADKNFSNIISQKKKKLKKYWLIQKKKTLEEIIQNLQETDNMLKEDLTELRRTLREEQKKINESVQYLNEERLQTSKRALKAQNDFDNLSRLRN